MDKTLTSILYRGVGARAHCLKPVHSILVFINTVVDVTLSFCKLQVIYAFTFILNIGCNIKDISEKNLNYQKKYLDFTLWLNVFLKERLCKS